MANVTVDSIEIIRKGNPAEPLVAYIRETCSIDPNVIRKIVAVYVSGRNLKLRDGRNVYRVIDKKNREICRINEDGKSDLGF
jgi:midasin (ATPase involved in ribosome maturation)